MSINARKINFEDICTYVYPVITFMVKIFIAFIYSLTRAVVNIHQLLFNIWIYFKVKSLQRYVKQKPKSFSKDMWNGWHIRFAFFNLFIFYIIYTKSHATCCCSATFFYLKFKQSIKFTKPKKSNRVEGFTI